MPSIYHGSGAGPFRSRQVLPWIWLRGLAAQLAGIPSARTCSLGPSEPAADDALTIKLDNSVGAGQRRRLDLAGDTDRSL